MNSFYVDVKNTALAGVSIVPQTIATATTTNGTGVDCRNSDGPITLHAYTGDVSATTTFEIKLQESDDNSTNWTDISGATTGSVVGNAGDNQVYLIGTTDSGDKQRTKRYVRVAIVTTGTVSLPVAAGVLTRKKITHTSIGVQTSILGY